MTQLQALQRFSTVVADTIDFQQLIQFQPQAADAARLEHLMKAA